MHNVPHVPHHHPVEAAALADPTTVVVIAAAAGLAAAWALSHQTVRVATADRVQEIQVAAILGLHRLRRRLSNWWR